MNEEAEFADHIEMQEYAERNGLDYTWSGSQPGDRMIERRKLISLLSVAAESEAHPPPVCFALAKFASGSPSARFGRLLSRF
jgi:hypothetical protein